MPTQDRVDSTVFENLALDSLHRRTSEKWAKYPPEVLPAWVAEMDFPLAPAIRRAVAEALENDDCGYAWASGLGEAFTEFAREHFNWHVEDDRVFPITDVMGGIALVLVQFTPRGSAVVINPPVYPPFFEVLRDIERQVVEVPLRCTESDRWELDFDALERAFAQGARAYLLCSPQNPVGRIWSEEDLRRVLDLAAAYDVVVVTDEIHAAMEASGHAHTPILKLAGENDRVFTVTSASKSWNIPGLKCAVVVAGSASTRDALRRHWKNSPTETLSRVGHWGAIATVAAFREGRPWLVALRAHLDRTRLLFRKLADAMLPGVQFVTPQAGYLVWLDCSAMQLGDNPARVFLKQGRVALSPGIEFGSRYGQFARVNIGTSSAIVTQIVERMARALELKG